MEMHNDLDVNINLDFHTGIYYFHLLHIKLSMIKSSEIHSKFGLMSISMPWECQSRVQDILSELLCTLVYLSQGGWDWWGM